MTILHDVCSAVMDALGCGHIRPKKIFCPLLRSEIPSQAPICLAGCWLILEEDIYRRHWKTFPLLEKMSARSLRFATKNLKLLEQLHPKPIVEKKERIEAFNPEKSQGML